MLVSIEEVARYAKTHRPPERPGPPVLIEAVEVKEGLLSVAAPFKHLQVRPRGTADVVLDVSERRLYGTYESSLVNTGLTPIVGLTASSSGWYDSGEGWVEAFRGYGTRRLLLRRGEEHRYTVRWVIADRPLDILYALVRIFTTGRVRARESVLAEALRYRARLESVAEIPVSGVSVRW